MSMADPCSTPWSAQKTSLASLRELRKELIPTFYLTLRDSQHSVCQFPTGGLCHQSFCHGKHACPITLVPHFIGSSRTQRPHF